MACDQDDIQSWAKKMTETFNFLNGKVRLLVCGGHDSDIWLNSVESFDCKRNAWQQEAVMATNHCGASAYIYGPKMFVKGRSEGSHFYIFIIG